MLCVDSLILSRDEKGSGLLEVLQVGQVALDGGVGEISLGGDVGDREAALEGLEGDLLVRVIS